MTIEERVAQLESENERMAELLNRFLGIMEKIQQTQTELVSTVGTLADKLKDKTFYGA